MDRGLISDELKELFQSFSVDIPEDASGNSFVRDILNDNLVCDFVSDIRSLSQGVALTRDLLPGKEALKFPPTVHPVYVLEVNIDSGPEIWEEKTVIFD